VLRDEDLKRIYQRSRGPVALCDESHRLGPGDEVGFYTVTATLFDRASMEPARRAFAEFAGPRGWHTTEAYEAGYDRRIHRMLATIAEHAEWSIVTVAAPIQGHGRPAAETARRECLTTLLPEITRGSDPVQVVVMDTRGDERADAADRHTAAMLRGQKIIPARTLLRHADDKLEPLLGAADAVGWAARRMLARDEPQWWENVADVATILHAPTGTRIDLAPKDNSAAATAVPPAPDGVAGLTSAEADNRRPSLLPSSSSHAIQGEGNAGQTLRRLLDQAFPVPAREEVRRSGTISTESGTSPSIVRSSEDRIPEVENDVER
jgi:hypothetical protein